MLTLTFCRLFPEHLRRRVAGIRGYYLHQSSENLYLQRFITRFTEAAD